ncbi:MAG: TIGR03943 family protein [Bacilli bacterium]|nr:TIGR03943 family protein [Bacilli bacterium]
MKNKYLSIISIAYSILLIYLLISNNIKNYLAKSMFIYVIIASIILLIIGIVSLINKDNHYKFKIIDLALLLPLIIFIFSGNGRLTTSLAENRIINKKNTTITNKNNKSDKPVISIKEDEAKDGNDIYFDIKDESFVTLSDYLSFDERATKYLGKRVRVIGFLVDYETMLPNNYYSIGRYVITCCAADASYVGFFFKYDKKIDPDEWYEIEGTLEEFEDTKGFKHLAIVVDKIDIIDGMQQEQYVYPCYAYDNGKCAEVSKYNLN